MHAAPCLDFCCYCWLLSLWLINRHWKFLATYSYSHMSWYQLIMYNVIMKDAEYDIIKKIYNYIMLVNYHSLCFNVVKVTRYMHLCMFKDHRIWDCFSPKNNNDINTWLLANIYSFIHKIAFLSFNMWVYIICKVWIPMMVLWHWILLTLVCIHHTLLNMAIIGTIILWPVIIS